MNNDQIKSLLKYDMMQEITNLHKISKLSIENNLHQPKNPKDTYSGYLLRKIKSYNETK